MAGLVTRHWRRVRSVQGRLTVLRPIRLSYPLFGRGGGLFVPLSHPTAGPPSPMTRRKVKSNCSKELSKRLIRHRRHFQHRGRDFHFAGPITMGALYTSQRGQNSIMTREDLLVATCRSACAKDLLLDRVTA